MKKFTDLLENYLYARDVLNEARENYDGHSFGYFHDADIAREDIARQMLDQYIENMVIQALEQCVNKLKEKSGH